MYHAFFIHSSATHSRILGLPLRFSWKESACDAGDLGSIPGSGRSPGEGKGYPLQYSGLENSVDYTVAKSQTRLSNFHFYFSIDRHIEIASMSWLL